MTTERSNVQPQKAKKTAKWGTTKVTKGRHEVPELDDEDEGGHGVPGLDDADEGERAALGPDNVDEGEGDEPGPSHEERHDHADPPQTRRRMSRTSYAGFLP